MDRAICCNCVKDFYLKKIIEDEGEPLECSECGQEENNAITVEYLGNLMEPILREHFVLGPTVRKFGADDKDWWEQEGESMEWIIQEVLGQDFGFVDEIVDAVINAEDVYPGDGDDPFWDDTSLYVESRVQVGHYYDRWRYTLAELKHNRRFFSPAAQVLFGNLFRGVEDLKAWTGNKKLPVVRTLPSGAQLYRARICNSRAMLSEIYANPLKHIGPPPRELSRAGRMNAEGVVVFYGATEQDTCLAEMRPALKNELAIITVKTTKPLRLLDFSRLEQAHGGKVLSYFQPDFTEEVEKHMFLRSVHSLISQPIIPGRESDYLITQTMAEYLAYVHDEPLDGILFASAQRAKGTNIVLFADPYSLNSSSVEVFPIQYVDESIRILSTELIKYKHEEVNVSVLEDGRIWVHDDLDEDDAL